MDIIERAAKAAHEANRAYCEAIGDLTQVAWDDAPEWQKKSAVAGVQFIERNPDASPEAQHMSWLAEKKADGWTYGDVKDPERKQHPCFMPYGDLPASQRVKDELFGTVVRAVLASEG